MINTTTEKLVRRSTLVNAPPEAVWAALTTPEQTQKYMFNCAVSSDWKKGSPITWTGNYQGYESGERGVILECDPGKKLKYTSFDPNFGLTDTPENYLHITYELEDREGQTHLSTTIENFNDDPKRCEHIAGGWDHVVLPGLQAMFAS